MRPKVRSTLIKDAECQANDFKRQFHINHSSLVFYHFLCQKNYRNILELSINLLNFAIRRFFFMEWTANYSFHIIFLIVLVIANSCDIDFNILMLLATLLYIILLCF